MPDNLSTVKDYKHAGTPKSPPGLPAPDSDPNEIRRALGIYHPPEDVVEVRVLQAGGRANRIDSGYYDDREMLVERVEALRYRPPGIYITLHKIDPALFHRTSNKIKEWVKQTTADRDVLRLHWLPIDLDPVRPAGISSSDKEHDAAIAKAVQVRNHLIERGWPAGAFVLADSGNGAHLCARIDLEPSKENVALVKNCLGALDKRHSDEGVKVDVTTYNPARIWKLPGTVARKGDHSRERPYRMARIIESPAESFADFKIVPRELLEKLTGELEGQPEAEGAKSKEIRERQTPGASKKKSSPAKKGRAIDLEALIQQHDIKIKQRKVESDGRIIFELAGCPFDPNHNSGEAFLTQFPDGGAAFNCHHNSCKDYGLRDFAAKLGIELPNSDRSLEDIYQVLPDIIAAFQKKPADAAENEDYLRDLAILREKMPFRYDEAVAAMGPGVKKNSLKSALNDYEKRQKSNHDGRGEDAASFERPTVRDAVLALKSVCDSATTRDGAGFNKFDADYFNVLAGDYEGGKEIRADRELDAYGRLKKYRRQLRELGIKYSEIIFPGSDTDSDFTIEDFCTDPEDKGKWRFSRVLAAESLQDGRLSIAMMPDGRDIHWFDGQIYRSTGIPKISQIAYSVAGDAVTRKDLLEVIDRIKSEQLLDPVEFNLDPFAMPLLNGVLNLKTGEFRDYTPDDLFTFRYNAEWDPDRADYDQFLRFLCTSLPDPRDVLTAIDIMTAIALRIPFDVIVQLLGGGANGKGVFEKVLLALFTSERSTALTLDELKRSRFGAGALFDKDLWIVTEVEEVAGAVSALKKIATGEFLDTDVKYGNRRTGRPHAVPILDSNNAFDFGDESYGRKRRVVRLDFCYTFGDESGMRPIDRQLLQKLTTPEARAGLVQLIAARAPSLIQSGKIYNRKTTEEAEAEYKRQQYSLNYFCNECLAGERAGYVAVGDVFEAYTEFCRLFKVPTPASKIALGKYIAKAFRVESSLARDGSVNGQPFRVYPGLYIAKKPSEVYADHLLAHTVTDVTATDWCENICYTKKPDTRDYTVTDVTGVTDKMRTLPYRIKSIFENFAKINFLSIGDVDQNPVTSVASVTPPCSIPVSTVTATVTEQKPSVTESDLSAVSLVSEAGHHHTAYGQKGACDPGVVRETPSIEHVPIAEQKAEADAKTAEHAEKFATPEPKPDDGPVHGRSMAEWREMARRCNGLTYHDVEDELRVSIVRARDVIAELHARGWLADAKGRIHPPKEVSA
jgi:hypothetical protein